MKCLKELLARLANREDGVRGAFFQSRFQSVAILDGEALLADGVYIDLNPVAAGIAQTPEASEYTSIKDRLGSRAENWQARMEKLRKGRLYGRFFAASREKLREMAERLKVRRLVNLTGCAVA